MEFEKKTTSSHHVLQYVSVTLLLARFLFFSRLSFRTAATEWVGCVCFISLSLLPLSWQVSCSVRTRRIKFGRRGRLPGPRECRVFIRHPLPRGFQPRPSAQRVLSGSRPPRSLTFHDQGALCGSAPLALVKSWQGR